MNRHSCLAIDIVGFSINFVLLCFWCQSILPILSTVTSTTPDVYIQYIPRDMHTGFALLCFVVVIHWLIFPYPSGLLHWHCGNLTIAPVPAKQPWWIWINTSCEFIMNDCITTTKQSTTKPCAYFLGYTVSAQEPMKQPCRILVNSTRCTDILKDHNKSLYYSETCL